MVVGERLALDNGCREFGGGTIRGRWACGISASGENPEHGGGALRAPRIGGPSRLYRCYIQVAPMGVVGPSYARSRYILRERRSWAQPPHLCDRFSWGGRLLLGA
jgi:hypothetical protein